MVCVVAVVDEVVVVVVVEDDVVVVVVVADVVELNDKKTLRLIKQFHVK